MGRKATTGPKTRGAQRGADFRARKEKKIVDLVQENNELRRQIEKEKERQLQLQKEDLRLRREQDDERSHLIAHFGRTLAVIASCTDKQKQTENDIAELKAKYFLFASLDEEFLREEGDVPEDLNVLPSDENAEESNEQADLVTEQAKNARQPLEDKTEKDGDVYRQFLCDSADCPINQLLEALRISKDERIP